MNLNHSILRDWIGCCRVNVWSESYSGVINYRISEEGFELK